MLGIPPLMNRVTVDAASWFTTMYVFNPPPTAVGSPSINAFAGALIKEAIKGD